MASNAACNGDTQSQDKCIPCKTCQFMQIVHPDFICSTGGDSYDRQLVEGCNACIDCPDDRTKVHPCYGGKGSVDTTLCMRDYQSVKATSCEDGYYLSPTSKLVASIPPLHQIAVNSIYNVFAWMDPFWGEVQVWPSKDLNYVIVPDTDTDLSAEPLMQYKVQESSVRLFASCIWSQDGKILYVLHMDGTIALMQVLMTLLDACVYYW